jgi:hypothetical protein
MTSSSSPDDQQLDRVGREARRVDREAEPEPAVALLPDFEAGQQEPPAIGERDRCRVRLVETSVPAPTSTR